MAKIKSKTERREGIENRSGIEENPSSSLLPGLTLLPGLSAEQQAAYLKIRKAIEELTKEIGDNEIIQNGESFSLHPEFMKLKAKKNDARIYEIKIESGLPQILRRHYERVIERILYGTVLPFPDEVGDMVETYLEKTGRTPPNPDRIKRLDSHEPNKRADLDQAGESNGTTKATKKLPPCHQKAMMQYLKAIADNPALNGSTDKQIHEAIQENQLDEGEGIPSYGTWSRYLREARNIMGENKNKPRKGRTGRSIVKKKEI